MSRYAILLQNPIHFNDKCTVVVRFCCPHLRTFSGKFPGLKSTLHQFVYLSAGIPFAYGFHGPVVVSSFVYPSMTPCEINLIWWYAHRMAYGWCKCISFNCVSEDHVCSSDRWLIIYLRILKLGNEFWYSNIFDTECPRCNVSINSPG